MILKPLLLFLLLTLFFPLASSLEEIQFTSDTSQAVITEISHTNLYLIEDSPQQKPSRPYSLMSYTLTLDRRLLKIENQKGKLLENFYRPDKQIDYTKYYEYDLTIRSIYDLQGNLLSYDYYDAQNQLIQRESVTITPYSGTNALLRNSYLFSHAYEVINGDIIKRLDYTQDYRVFSSTLQPYLSNKQYSHLLFYKVYNKQKFLERETYYDNQQLVLITYYIRQSSGRLVRTYNKEHPSNQIISYQNIYYHSCSDRDVIRTIFQFDSDGGRILDYRYDTRDPCNPLTHLLAIVDRRTGQPAYQWTYDI